MSTTHNALTAHVVVGETFPVENLIVLKQHLRHELVHAGIQHATLEVEFGAGVCGEEREYA